MLSCLVWGLMSISVDTHGYTRPVHPTFFRRCTEDFSLLATCSISWQTLSSIAFAVASSAPSVSSELGKFWPREKTDAALVWYGFISRAETRNEQRESHIESTPTGRRLASDARYDIVCWLLWKQIYWHCVREHYNYPLKWLSRPIIIDTHSWIWK